MDETPIYENPSAPLCFSRHNRSPLFSRSTLMGKPEDSELTCGNNSLSYRTLGAHCDEVDRIAGTRFSVWAPNARAVSVVCDLNGWRHGRNCLKPSNSGKWSGFVPGIGPGDIYKFSIKTETGNVINKADPYAFASQYRPETASVVCELDGYPWRDQAWLRTRAESNWLERPMSIYEVHLGSWKQPDDDRLYFSYRELAHQLVDYALEIGFTHLQLMPITEFPFDGSWGYQTTGYFAPTSRFGSPSDLQYFVDYCHQANIGVLIDWVPAHFPDDDHALCQFDGTFLYEHEDPRKGRHPDWGTLIFNYGRNEVRDLLLSSARFWLDVYHVDGLRVDAVASMLYLDYSRKDGEWCANKYGGRENLEAIQFMQDLNTMVHAEFPGILTIAEESTDWEGVSRPVEFGGLGFSMKWDMGWMNDTLRHMSRDAVHRRFHQKDLSFRMMYAFSENFVLPLSHDEVVHGKHSLLSKMPGDRWQQFANLRLLYGYQYSIPGKKLLFMGGEIGQWIEWNHDDALDWALLEHTAHDSLKRYVGDLNRLYNDYPALHETDFDSSGFRWIQCDNKQDCVLAFVRTNKRGDDLVVVVCNFTPVPRDGYRIGVPQDGFFAEIINSDATIYGGGNIGNEGGLHSESIASHGFEQSLVMRVPPLAMIAFKPA